MIERIQSVTPDDPIQGLTGLEVHNELSSGVSNHFDSIIDVSVSLRPLQVYGACMVIEIAH